MILLIHRLRLLRFTRSQERFRNQCPVKDDGFNMSNKNRPGRVRTGPVGRVAEREGLSAESFDPLYLQGFQHVSNTQTSNKHPRLPSSHPESVALLHAISSVCTHAAIRGTFCIIDVSFDHEALYAYPHHRNVGYCDAGTRSGTRGERRYTSRRDFY